MSLSSNDKKQLHWTQRVALVRHNLHSASRSGDFTFFKTLQAAGMMEGTNHVATLSASIGDEADTILAAMDNLNAGLAYVHQDAFKNVYDNLKNSMRDTDKEADRSKLYVDITVQKNTADLAIDKMASSAITIINQQPANVQDQAANVWITGATIVSDAVQIALYEMDCLDSKLDDFIRMEESWNTVKAAVVCAITGLKGVFSLMDVSSPTSADNKTSASARSASIASASSAMFRRLSNAFATSPTSSTNMTLSPPHSRNASVSSTHSANFANFNRNGSVSSVASSPVYRTPNYMRNSVSTSTGGCPTSQPPGPTGDLGEWKQHKLSTIPPTPGTPADDDTDPFDASMPPIPPMPEVEVLQPVPLSQSPVPVGQPMTLAQRRLSQMVN